MISAPPAGAEGIALRSSHAGFLLYGQDGCDECTALGAYLIENGIPFLYVSVPSHAERMALYELWGLPQGRRTMPQLVFGNIALGGLYSVSCFPAEILRELVP
ncbi:protein of unknown function (plasmid) [Rhodovastum atsumiense]|nr:glutaredoxin domain-containing protein [Rhodovastum atsumiense]CAH2606217.1 protein of unknown function [Rhodovastum atsumiense]